ncbi:MAG TPA: ribosome biogenesis GTPase Der [Candidatus Angelobacter sp.]|nr:ribosome biogenesis GTPase Der [Candidatus Angelobacter sp.]
MIAGNGGWRWHPWQKIDQGIHPDGTGLTEAKNKSQAPLLAIVGRPNVGKSTLFNRLIGRRRAIVGDEPGITRDRLYGEINWDGHLLRVVDTGGIVPDDKALIPAEIFRQARVALEESNAVVMVVDARTELASPDMELARLLQRLGKPLFLAVNKVDSAKQEAAAQNFRTLGIREVFPIAAEHGLGTMELMDAIMAVVPVVKAPDEPGPERDRHQRSAGRPARNAANPDEQPVVTETGLEEHEPSNLEESEPSEAEEKETKVAIIGHPNVGKSTLLNILTGSSRAIVSPIAGTTRDAIDELIEKDGHTYRFIDTAGIRRKGKTHLMAEKLSVVMARKHLEAADVALLVIDAGEGVTGLDATIGGYAHESGRSVIVIINKWDLVGPGRKDGRPPADRELFEKQARRALKFLDYAPMVFVSAAGGKNIDKIFRALELVATERRKRIGTSQMNRFLESVDFTRASVPHRQQVKIFYMTQAYASPPTFILFTDKDVKLHFSYERFLQNQIRQKFGFVGTPIWIKNRPRSKVVLPPRKAKRRG